MPGYSISHYCANSELCKGMVTMKRQCWSNAQYSRRECLEVVEIPRDVDDKNLETEVLSIFIKIGCTIGPTFINDCYRLGKSNDRVIVKFTFRMDWKQILKVSKYLRDLNIEDLDLPGAQRYIKTKVYVLTIEFYGRKLKDYKILVQLIIYIFLVQLSKLKLLKIVFR